MRFPLYGKLLCIGIAVAVCPTPPPAHGQETRMEPNPSATSPVVEAEEIVYSNRYSNNGASPM